MAVSILKKTQTEVTVLVTGNTAQTVTLASLALANETVSSPIADIHAIKFSVPAGVINVTRNAVPVLTLGGTDHWQLNGYSINVNNTYDIVVNLSTATSSATVLLTLSKLGGYIGPDWQALGRLPG